VPRDDRGYELRTRGKPLSTLWKGRVRRSRMNRGATKARCEQGWKAEGRARRGLYAARIHSVADWRFTLTVCDARP